MLKDPTTILLVDDDDGFRRSWAALLIREGFQILEADCAEAALAALSHRDGEVDLMLSDIEMPGVGGLELASRARELRPTLKVLLMSGSPSRVLQPIQDVDQDPLLRILIKPFRLEQLTRIIREVLQQ